MTTEKITCADCGEEIELDAAHEVDGSAYCDDCVVQCEDCGDYVLNGDAKTNDSGDNYCESCYDDNYVKCEACGCEVRKDRAYSSDSGDDYCRDCYNENFSHCESCNCEVHNEDSVSTESGDTYCQSCYDDHYDHCSSCGCEVSTDDTVCVNGDVYCEGCALSDSNEWEPGFFRPVQSCGKVGSRRMFGVELETSACPDYYELEGSTVFVQKTMVASTARNSFLRFFPPMPVLTPLTISASGPVVWDLTWMPSVASMPIVTCVTYLSRS